MASKCERISSIQYHIPEVSPHWLPVGFSQIPFPGLLQRIRLQPLADSARKRVAICPHTVWLQEGTPPRFL